MGCFRDREKGPPERKQRWGFIELNDFKCRSCWTFVAYGWLWFMGFVSVAVYAVDTFTAINLLAFDRWSSQVKPAIDFDVSKWIFAGCIFFSWALLLYESIRALRVIKKDGVAASYMDPIAASLQCMRSRGWKRFLVYNELTKSKKGVDYVAFFVYFAFQGAIRIIIAEGPRQFVNGVTLYAVMRAQLINGGKTENGNSHFEQFFANIETIADENYQQAVIYASMLFTFVIWVFGALCLLIAGILYIAFLWHYIPQHDGGLRIYCRRKIDRRLEKIIAEKWGTAEADEAKKREKQEKKAELKRQKTGELEPPSFGIKRAPTLPEVGIMTDVKKDEAIMLGRQDSKSTTATLPLYSSQPSTIPGSGRQTPLPDFFGDRPSMPDRSATMNTMRSKASFDSNAPLLSNAGFAYDDRVSSPAPTYYSRNNSSTSVNKPALPGRMNTQSTQASQRSYTPISRMDTPGSQRSFTPTSATSSRPPPGQRSPVRSNTGSGLDEPYSAISENSPVYSFDRPPMPPLPRQDTINSYQQHPRRQESNVSGSSHSTSSSGGRLRTMDSVNPPYRGPTPTSARNPSLGRQNSFSRPFTPASTRYQPTQPHNPYTLTSQPPTCASNFSMPQPAEQSLYMPFNPGQHGITSTPISQAPRRNVTVGGPGPPPENDYFSHTSQRSVTAPVQGRIDSSYAGILDDYGASTPDEYHESQRPYHRRGSSSYSTGPARTWQGSF